MSSVATSCPACTCSESAFSSVAVTACSVMTVSSVFSGAVSSCSDAVSAAGFFTFSGFEASTAVFSSIVVFASSETSARRSAAASPACAVTAIRRSFSATSSFAGAAPETSAVFVPAAPWLFSVSAAVSFSAVWSAVLSATASVFFTSSATLFSVASAFTFTSASSLFSAASAFCASSFLSAFTSSAGPPTLFMERVTGSQTNCTRFGSTFATAVVFFSAFTSAVVSCVTCVRVAAFAMSCGVFPEVLFAMFFFGSSEALFSSCFRFSEVRCFSSFTDLASLRFFSAGCAFCFG